MASLQLRSRRGSAIVETAVAMPLMLFVVFACLQFAWYVTKKVDVGNAARVAARAASLPQATSSSVIDAVSVQMNLAGFDSGEWELVLSPPDPSAAFEGDSITATIIADYDAVSLGRFGDWFAIPQDISATAVMRKEALD